MQVYPIIIGQAFLSLCNCLLRSVYLYAILRGRIKALYYNRSINTLYIYILIWACVWHIWDMVISLCSYGGIYMCVQCMIYYIISWVHIKGGYIIRVHITVGSIQVVYIQHGYIKGLYIKGSYITIGYIRVCVWYVVYVVRVCVYRHMIYSVQQWCVLQAIGIRACIWYMCIGTQYVCVCVCTVCMCIVYVCMCWCMYVSMQLYVMCMYVLH